MSSDDRRLPAPRSTSNGVTEHLDGTARALRVRDPVTGFFHRIGSLFARRALDHHTEETEAFTRNMSAQSTAVRSMISLRDTVDEYRAREELADLSYDNTRAKLGKKIRADQHAREIAEKRRKVEHYDADRGIFNADYGLDLQRSARESDAEWRRKQRELRNLNVHTEITVTRDELAQHAEERERRRTDARQEEPAQGSTLDMLRYQLLEQYRQAVASGAEDEAARINDAIAALEGKR